MLLLNLIENLAVLLTPTIFRDNCWVLHLRSAFHERGIDYEGFEDAFGRETPICFTLICGGIMLRMITKNILERAGVAIDEKS